MTGEEEPRPPLYVRRTKETLWHWCRNCADYPKSAMNANGLLMVMTRPTEGDLCPICRTLTKTQECQA